MHRFKIRVQVECGDYNKEIKFCADTKAGTKRAPVEKWAEELHESLAASAIEGAEDALAKRAKPARKKAAKKKAATKPAANE